MLDFPIYLDDEETRAFKKTDTPQKHQTPATKLLRPGTHGKKY